MKVLRAITLVMLGLAGAVTFGLAVYLGGGSMDLIGFAFAVWALLPYGPLAVMAFVRRKSVGHAVTVFVGTLLIAGFGLVGYYEGFFASLDAQGGLLFIFVPIWQWVGSVLTSAAALVVWRVGRPNVSSCGPVSGREAPEKEGRR